MIENNTSIHPTALVETERLGLNVRVFAFAHVMVDAQLGDNVQVGDHCFIESGVTIGANSTIKNQVCLWQGVTVEANAFIGPRVTFTNDRWPRSPRAPAMQDHYADKRNWLAETTVRHGASIGAAAVICPGIELGPFCTIAAGAVVTRTVPAFALVRGNPAVQVGDVCSCGQKLAGTFDEAYCECCGQTGEQRRRLLANVRKANECTIQKTDLAEQSASRS